MLFAALVDRPAADDAFSVPGTLQLENVLLSAGFLLLGGIALMFSVWATRRWG